MLEKFDHAKDELRRTRSTLSNLPRETSAGDQKLKFLRVQIADRLQDIYVDSKSTAEHLKTSLENASADEMIWIIDQALEAAPPVRRALGSEEEGRTVQALVDAAVWKSRFVWLFTWTAGALIVITLAALGYTVVDLNKQADKAREAIADARTKAQDEVAKMSKSVDEISKKAAEIDTKKNEIEQSAQALQKRLGNPDDEVNRITLRFGSELARLGELEQEWSRRRERTSADLAKHLTFINEEENKATRKRSEFDQILAQHTATIENLIKGASQLQSRLDSNLEKSRNDEASFAKQVALLEGDADAMRRLLQQSTADSKVASDGAQKVSFALRDSETTRAGLRALEAELTQLSTGVKATAEKVSKALSDFQTAFEDHASKQTKNYDDAVLTAKNRIASTTEEITRASVQATASMNSFQSGANQMLEAIRVAQDGARQQVADTAAISNSISQLRTDITKKYEDLKTDEERLKGERDRARLDLAKVMEIIKIVDDRRSEVGDKLRTLLDDRPTLDFALGWKLILGSKVLIVLAGAVLALLFAWVGTLVFLIRARRRHTDPATNAA
ncbi:MAG TPA: hypothetical protein VNK51_25505 [Bradyrhizobium sp.]|nr:hypothetical protein [Bradyrhizobium sp.]